jgi:transposase-like protein
VAAAQAGGVSERTARKWRRRFEREGEAGLADRSSAAGRMANKTPEHTIEAIAALRRLRFTGAQIAELSTLRSRRCRHPQGDRAGQALAAGPAEPPKRCERRHPGELVHDIKRTGSHPLARRKASSDRELRRPRSRCARHRTSVARWSD